MVGGFVQQEKVRVLEKDFGKFYTHVPALAESLGRPVKFRRQETKAAQSPFRLNLRWFGMIHRKPVVQFIKIFNQLAIISRFIISSFAELPGNPLYFPLCFITFIKGGHCLVQHTPSPVVFHYLGKISYCYMLRFVNTTGGRVHLSADDFHERTFSCAIFANESDLVGLADMEIDTGEKLPTSETDCEIVDGYHLSYFSINFRNCSGQAIIRTVLLFMNPRVTTPSAQSTPS